MRGVLILNIKITNYQNNKNKTLCFYCFFLIILAYNSIHVRVVQKKLFFFEFNPSPPQIVRLVMETPHTKFQLIWFTGRGGHAIRNFDFSSKNMNFLPTLALIFADKISGI